MEDNSALMARQAVQSMVGEDVQVSIDADRALRASRMPDGERSGQSAGGIVSVELTGRTSEFQFPAGVISATGESCAWIADEIVSAAQRAAERVLRVNPSWRRVAQRA